MIRLESIIGIFETSHHHAPLPIPPTGDQVHIPHPEKSDLVLGFDE